MIDGDELKFEIAHDLNIALANGVSVGRQSMLFELGLNKSKSQSRTDDWDICSHAKKVWHSPDVVFVAVSKKDSNYVAQAIFQVAKIRQNHIDAWLMFLWEKDSAVNNENFAVDFKHGHVSTDFTNSTEWNDSHNVFFEWSRMRQG